MLSENDLLQKKKVIEQAKTKVAELQGEEKALVKTLKEKYKCNTLEEAKALIIKNKKEVDKLSEDIEELSIEIEEEYFSEDGED